MSIVEKAKRLDAAIRASGGLAKHWRAEQVRRCAEGLPFYRELIDPETGEVIATFDPDSASESR